MTTTTKKSSITGKGKQRTTSTQKLALAASKTKEDNTSRVDEPSEESEKTTTASQQADKQTNEGANPPTFDRKAGDPISEEELAHYKKMLDKDGFVVIPGVVSEEKASQYESRFFDWLEALNPNIKRTDKSTWVGKQYPATRHGIFKEYNIGQAQFIWDVRDEDNIVSVYRHLWGTDNLLTSFDGACFVHPSQGEWHENPHTDQGAILKVRDYMTPKTSPFSKAQSVRDFACVQGLLNLRENGPKDGGFVAYRGSHKGHCKFFEKAGLEDYSENWFTFESFSKLTKQLTEKYTKELLRKYVDKGKIVLSEGETLSKISKSNKTSKEYGAIEEKAKKLAKDKIKKIKKLAEKHLQKYERVKVCMNPGDFVIWYSRTIHTVSPTQSDNHRMCVYVSMLPRKYASPRDLKKRIEYFEGLRTTSHWACIKLKVNPKHPRAYGGDTSPIDNFTVCEKLPTLTKRMRRLVGYDE